MTGISTIRRIEREVLRRRCGNKALGQAYRRTRTRGHSNYITQKKMLTRKGKAIVNGFIVLATAVALLLIK